uniref:Link domain-containing protein n=1 Tax=Callorhinchus milii TaxID=7868 RepID=A0A4W3JC20_CALMI
RELYYARMCFVRSLLMLCRLPSRCQHGGVSHQDRGARYQLSLAEAVTLCDSLGSSLANLGQVQAAQRAGFQTCRYGWIQDGLVAISRVTPHANCANNLTGVYTSARDSSQKFDALCFNYTVCPVKRFETSLWCDETLHEMQRLSLLLSPSLWLG